MTPEEKDKWMYEMGFFKTGGGIGCLYIIILCIAFWGLVIWLIIR